MAELTIPDLDFDEIPQIELDQNFQINMSVWTGRRRGVALPGAEKWYISAQRTFETEDEERPWRAFLFGLQAQINKFRWQVACSQRTGSNPVVSVSGNARSITLSGLPTSATVLTAGRFMTVPLPSGHYRLVCLTSDLNTNGSGVATASFVPALNESPSVGATVETIAPFAMMALIDPRQGIKGQGGSSSLQLVCVEAL